jgi:hypothetical protein
MQRLAGNVASSVGGEMMKRVIQVAVAAALCQFATVQGASAHHAFAAEYDADKPIELTGILTKVEWVNPHSWIYLDVKGSGLRKSDLPIGAQVHVKGYLAKSGLPIGNATSVTLPDGRNLYTGSSGTGAPGQ